MLKIYTFVSTNPALLELQYNSFKRHLLEPFEFIVVNNGAYWDVRKWAEIHAECDRLGLQCANVLYDESLATRLYAKGGDPAFTRGRYTHMTAACGYAVAWAWENLIAKDTGNVCLCHHDMLMVAKDALSDHLKDVPLVFVPQTREGIPVHLWEGFVLANLDRLPKMDATSWWFGMIGDTRVDVGGMSHYWFQKHPEVRWTGITTAHVEDTPEVNFHPAIFEHLLLEGRPVILHYRAASDWMKQGPEYHEKKMQWLRGQLETR